jgi:hypothetical protein
MERVHPMAQQMQFVAAQLGIDLDRRDKADPNFGCSLSEPAPITRVSADTFMVRQRHFAHTRLSGQPDDRLRMEFTV